MGLLVTALVLGFIARYFLSTVYKSTWFTGTTKRKILLVFAHPDDECMFFSPTVSELVQSGHQVRALCLCNGDADGKGNERPRELEKSCEKLGISEVKVVYDDRITDGMDKQWDRTIISSHVATAVKSWDSDTLLTFDEWGVSSHPNHISVHHGVKHYLHTTPEGKKQVDQGSMKGYQLETTGIVRKYIGPLDFWYSRHLLREGDILFAGKSWSTGWNALKQHVSQLVWYRRLFFMFARYAYFNTLRPL